MEYADFRKQYEERHSASVPVKKPPVNEYPIWLYWLVFLMFISAAILSGVHTVPTVYQTIETSDIISPLVRSVASLASFVAVELAIFVSAYAMIRGNKWSVWLVLITSFVVAIVANLQSVSRALAGESSDPGTVTVVLALGVGMPLIALMAGKLFVDMHKAQRAANLRAEHEFSEERKTFEAEVLAAYEQYVRKLDRRPSAPSVTVRPLASAADTADADRAFATGHGYTKRTDAKDIVRQHLLANPQDAAMPVRDLAGRLGVGKSTVGEVLQELKLRTEMATNGHHHD